MSVSGIENDIANKLAYAFDKVEPGVGIGILTRLEAALDEADKKVFNDLVLDMAWFMTDTESPDMNAYMLNKIAQYQQIPQRDAVWLANGHGKDMLGQCLVKSKEKVGLAFTPDPSEPGRIRYTQFDASGFFGHSTFDTLREAFDDAWGAGYRTLDAALLNELSVTQKWQEGMAFTLEIQAHNAKVSSLPKSEPSLVRPRP